MKNILITGANSYIGTSVEKWLLKEPDKYKIDTLDMQDENWREKDFSPYDVVFHVAGIAHIKETKEMKDLYYKVNRDLAFEAANKAKSEGVKQFIFLSSMSVYGLDTGIITLTTPLRPRNFYGKSKLQAEEKIRTLRDRFFKIATLRPPMIYGKGCKGNYPRLARLALRTPIFPNIDNKRSMLYIDNLSEFVKHMIDDCADGLFFPQNAEYVKTSEMVRLIAEVHGKKIVLTKMFNPMLKLLQTSTINKVFGNLVYDKNMSFYKSEYDLFSFKESIFHTEEEIS
jgi:UDP-glucose 4-epimerase